MSIISPWKQDFPIFSTRAYPRLCYLDSAATCLTPKHVADAIYHYQCYAHANSHKGLYQLSANVTEIVEQAREKVAHFLGANSGQQIIFNSGTTEALNLVAYSFVEPLLIKAQQQETASNIVISAAEHHANLLPWQRLAQQYQAELRVVDLMPDGTLNIEHLRSLLDSETRVLAVTHCSNVIGQYEDVQQICQLASDKKIATVVDGAQAVARGAVDVNAIGCDFYVFSAHKLYGPTGCGVLYGKVEHFDNMRPYQLGGGIISSVSYQQSEFIAGPLKFEPGSHNVAAIVGLVEAIDYLNDLSWHDINHYLNDLAFYLQQSLQELKYFKPLVKLPLPEYKGVTLPTLTSFQIKGVHCHDVASILDSEDIAVRAGHHCAQPLHQFFAVNSTIRASLGLYNDYSDIDRLVAGLDQAHQLMLS
ncbi:cysteine desulfurase [Thalassotalea insulae]|uniref:Probable cysteine desulfurase n=1 Tax=Thalassotalea insulae TaxID=2056778 RepID=A0ABQ6GX56_9GAMM|nr:aminotransferase class V-fold PLP-dependent enzyme [Thalassotalea insulae]GLX79310.1 cysteine desulfurase [Thalassotalea insulae]